MLQCQFNFKIFVLHFAVETIVPKEEKKAQETLVLKSDGTTQKLVHKSKVSRATAHQEKQVKTDRQTKQEKVEKQTRMETKVEKVTQSTKVEKVEKPKEPTENQETSEKTRLGRALTIQEESILLPLLQGLLAANGSETSSKSNHENTPSHEKELPTSNKNSRSNSLAEKNEKSKLLLLLLIFPSRYHGQMMQMFINHCFYSKVIRQKDQIFWMNYQRR